MLHRSKELISGLSVSVTILVIAATLGFATSASAELDTDPDPTWQVVTHIPDQIGLDTLVWDFAELNGVMYVGGSFAEVRKGSGESTSPQAHLAAFDVDTGAWISSFAPQLDGAVFTVEAAPDGSHLLIGGEFTGGIKAIDPTTGQTLPGWNTTATHDAMLGAVMDIEPDGVGGWYLGGNLTHVNDGRGDERRFRLARIDGNGILDPTWTPIAQGGRIYTIEKSKVADWVHLGGKFTSINVEEDSGYFATVSATTNELIDTVPHGYPEGAISSEGVLLQKIYGIEATTDQLWVGGEPHVLIALDPLTLETEKFWITNRGLGDVSGGGDIQAVHVTEDRVYAGCHCWGGIDGFDAIGPDDWPDYRDFVAWFATENRDPVKAVFAVDKANMEHSQTFLPELTGDDGVWAIIEDSNGRMWFGGEFTSAAGSYPGGFVRYSDAGIPTPRSVVEAGSQWSYHNSSSTPAAEWTSVGYDDNTWLNGQTELGFGDGDETTTINSASWSKSAYFRHEFEVTNAASAEHLAVEVTADDGYVAYLNGTEVGRIRMPAGTPTASTLANEAVWGTAEKQADRVLIPTSLLQDGTNVLAVEVHNASSGGDLSFDAELQGAGPLDLVPPQPEAPQRPGPNLLVSDYTSNSAVYLRFNKLTSNEAASYVIYRDGQELATTTNSTFVDRETSAGNIHTYTVATSGIDGTLSSHSNPVVVTVGSPVYNSRQWARLIATDWRYSVSDPGSEWTTTGFDDVDWSAGTDRIGFNQTRLDTTIETTDTLWLRSTVSISDDEAAPDALLLFIEADDAGVVYLNGKEVWRNNYATGPVNADSQPQQGLWASIDERVQHSLIPGELLVPGENTFAMQVTNETGSGDLFASLGAMGLTYDPAQAPLTPTALAATGIGTSGVDVTWTPAADSAAVASYGVYRNGQIVGVSTTGTFFDPAPEGTWDYTVKAVGPTGDQSAPTALASATVDSAEPVVPEPDPPAIPDEWACSVAVDGQTVEVSWPDIGANGYDVTPEDGTTRWTRATSYTSLSPAASYTIVAWGNGLSGQTVTCENPDLVVGVDWQCSVTADGAAVTVSWPDIGANGYDLIRDADPKKWVRSTSYSDATPGTDYTIVAWGNGVGGTTTQCKAP